MTCRPARTAVAGSLHVLTADGNKPEVFEWTGTAWSTPGTRWATKPGYMAALGWSYRGPVPITAGEDQSQEDGRCE